MFLDHFFKKIILLAHFDPINSLINTPKWCYTWLESYGSALNDGKKKKKKNSPCEASDFWWHSSTDFQTLAETASYETNSSWKVLNIELLQEDLGKPSFKKMEFNEKLSQGPRTNCIQGVQGNWSQGELDYQKLVEIGEEKIQTQSVLTRYDMVH